MGKKCHPQSKFPLGHGNVLHDWHAEVVALRSLNRFLLSKIVCDSASKYDYYISWEGYTGYHHYKPRDEVKLHMYCSEAPCGDPSMELTMAVQEDATPWEVPVRSAPHSPSFASPFLEGQELASGLVMAARDWPECMPAIG